MKMNVRVVSTTALLSLQVLLPSVAHACASCGCTLSPDWEASAGVAAPGWRMDVRYDHVNQNELRRGGHKISSAEASAVMNGGEPQEVERYTRNNYLTLALDYAVADWGLRLQLPWIARHHATLGTASDGAAAGPDGGQYVSRTHSVGDAQILGRYLGLLPTHRLALQLGVKLPTGSYTKTGSSTDPGAPGPVTIDPGLQPGTGSVDLITGVSWNDQWSDRWLYMAQALYQTPVATRAGYRPGNGVNVNLGLRYMGLAGVEPQLQLNVRRVAHDRGELADNVSTGGTLVYLSPGLNVPVDGRTSLYAYAQIPVYQKVRGVQLVPRQTVSVGVRHAF